MDKPKPHHPFNGRNARKIPRNLGPPGYRRRKRVTTSGSGAKPCLQRSSTSQPDKYGGTNLYSSACKARLQWWQPKWAPSSTISNAALISRATPSLTWSSI